MEAAAADGDESGFTLVVNVSGAKPNVGQAQFSLFDSEANYLKKPSFRGTVKIDASGKATFKFKSLKPGEYAVSVVYDEDSDGKLDTGFLGIPKELIAMSNNARGRLGPPKFKDTKFKVEKDTAIAIRFGKAKAED